MEAQLRVENGVVAVVQSEEAGKCSIALVGRGRRAEADGSRVGTRGRSVDSVLPIFRRCCSGVNCLWEWSGGGGSEPYLYGG